MKMIIVALALVACVYAAPASVEEPIPIIRSDFKQGEEGYNYGFETGNGISRDETGEIKEVLDEDNKPHSVVIVRGSYTYTDNEGKVESVNYYADESGFHPEGDSIPKPVSRR